MLTCLFIRSAKSLSATIMSVRGCDAPSSLGAVTEQGAQIHVNPNKRHITSQLWKRNDALAMKDGLHASIKFVTGDAYLGEWRANKPHGQGTLTYRSGNKIEGTSIDYVIYFMMLQSLIQTFVCIGLSVISGEFADGLPHGFGTYWIKDQELGLRMSYRGTFANNQRSGQGTMIYANGQKYSGSWAEGVRCGVGRMEYLNGDVYEGEWAHDMRHGQGTLYLANGDIYQGDWCKDKKHGQGTHFYVQHLKRYDGVWQLDVAKCGMYGALDHGNGQQCAVILPSLELDQPLQVLGDCAQSFLQSDVSANTPGR
jgi:hypothetical protein